MAQLPLDEAKRIVDNWITWFERPDGYRLSPQDCDRLVARFGQTHQVCHIRRKKLLTLIAEYKDPKAIIEACDRVAGSYGVGRVQICWAIWAMTEDLDVTVMASSRIKDERRNQSFDDILNLSDDWLRKNGLLSPEPDPVPVTNMHCASPGCVYFVRGHPTSQCYDRKGSLINRNTTSTTSTTQKASPDMFRTQTQRTIDGYVGQVTFAGADAQHRDPLIVWQSEPVLEGEKNSDGEIIKTAQAIALNEAQAKVDEVVAAQFTTSTKRSNKS